MSFEFAQCYQKKSYKGSSLDGELSNVQGN